jgi:hypothetical protein
MTRIFVTTFAGFSTRWNSNPEVLERLVISRDPPSASLNELIEATYMQWSEQMARVFI